MNVTNITLGPSFTSPVAKTGYPDPVFRLGYLWYFYDETFTDYYGPYATEQEAICACGAYARVVLEGAQAAGDIEILNNLTQETQ